LPQREDSILLSKPHDQPSTSTDVCIHLGKSSTTTTSHSF
jgi:hypothetical protein